MATLVDQTQIDYQEPVYDSDELKGGVEGTQVRSNRQLRSPGG